MQKLLPKCCNNPVVATQDKLWIKNSHFNLIFTAYLLETHLPCTIIWDTFALHLYLICNPTLLFQPARLLILEDFLFPPFYFSLRLYQRHKSSWYYFGLHKCTVKCCVFWQEKCIHKLYIGLKEIFWFFCWGARLCWDT